MKKEEKKKYYLYEMDVTILSIISIILLCFIFGITYIINKDVIFGSLKILVDKVELFLLLYFAYMTLHELLHSAAYVIYGGKFNKIVYGIALEIGVAYCLCKQNISKNNILHSLLYPFIFIGLITYFIALIFDLPMLLLLSIFNISGCSGDFIMFMFISKLKNIEFSDMDNPVAFAIYTNEDISKKSHFRLKYKGEVEQIERNDLRKVTVSKKSMYAILVLVVLLTILHFL